MTLAGAGGLEVPSGATGVDDAGGTNLVYAAGYLVPDVGGGVNAGTVTFTGTSETVEVTVSADVYSVRPIKAEMEAAVAHAAANRNALASFGSVRKEQGDAQLVFTQTFAGSFTFTGEGFSKNSSIYPRDFTYGARIQSIDIEGGNIFFEGLEIYSPRGGVRAGGSNGLLKDTARVDGAGWKNCWIHSDHPGEWVEAMLVASNGVPDGSINLNTHLLVDTLVAATDFRHDVIANTGDYSRNITFEDCLVENVKAFGENDVDNLFIHGCEMRNFVNGFVGTINTGPTGLKLHFCEFSGMWANAGDPGGSSNGLHSGLGGGSGVTGFTNQKAEWIGNSVTTGDERYQWEVFQERDVSNFDWTGTTGVKFNDPRLNQESYSNCKFLGNIIMVASGTGLNHGHGTDWDIGWNTFLSGRGDYLGAGVIQGGGPALNPEMNGTFTIERINIHHNIIGDDSGNAHDAYLWDGHDFWDNTIAQNENATPVGTAEGAHYDALFAGHVTKQLTFALKPYELAAAVALKPWLSAKARGVGAADNPYCTPGIAGKAAGHSFPTLSVPTTSASSAATGHTYDKTNWDGTVGAEMAQGSANGALQVANVAIDGSKQFTVIFQGHFKDDASAHTLLHTGGTDFRAIRNASAGTAAHQMVFEADEDTASSNSGNDVVYYSPKDKITDARGRVCILFSVNLETQDVTYWVNGKSRQWHDYSTYFMNNLVAGIGQINMHLLESSLLTDRFEGDFESLVIENQFIADADVPNYIAQDGYLRSNADISAATAFNRAPLVHFMGDKATIEAGNGNANGRAQAISLTGSQTITDVAGGASVPDAFVDANWSVATGAAANELDVTIASLPSDGGASITDVEYDVDGNNTWTSLPSYSGAGSYTLTMGAASTSYAIRLRAVNSVGNASAGNSESATSGAAAPAGFAVDIPSSGGQFTVSGGFNVWEGSDTDQLVVTNAGSPSGLELVGGGGGGGHRAGGGAGAGELVQITSGVPAFTAQTYTANVGAGGAGDTSGTAPGASGGNTRIVGGSSDDVTQTALGGGGGGTSNAASDNGAYGGNNGGSGGGTAGTNQTTRYGRSVAVDGVGNDGGNGSYTNTAGGGGGGSAAAGGAQSSGTGGSGGAGTASVAPGKGDTLAKGGDAGDNITHVDGANGVNPGDGGGGGSENIAARDGGNGAPGTVRIWWPV